MLINILIGLLGLNLVVFVHELGHLLVAKLFHIEVETFSVGWGKRLWGIQIGNTEYRLSLVPLGGYCRMKGENAFLQALDERADRIPIVPGTFFGAPYWQRIAVVLAGPVINLLFAALIFSGIWWIGFEYRTDGNRIVLASEVDQRLGPWAADRAGMMSGDRIVAIDGEPIDNFRDIRETVVASLDRPMEITVQRDDRRLALQVTPLFDPEIGAPQIGVSPWVDPIIESILPGSTADIAELRPGDRLTAVNGEPLRHTLDVAAAIRSTGGVLEFEFLRAGVTMVANVVIGENEEGEASIGIDFARQTFETPRVGLFGAIARGIDQTVDIFSFSLRTFSLLFRGLKIDNAIAGPIRLTQLVGAVTSAAPSFWSSLRAFFNILGLVNIALCITNLFPIPVFDGGQALLFTVEGVIRRPLRPIVISYYNRIGVGMIIVLLGLALFSDIRFLFFN